MLLEADAAVEAQAAATDDLLSRGAGSAKVVLGAVVTLRPQAVVLAVFEPWVSMNSLTGEVRFPLSALVLGKRQ